MKRLGLMVLVSGLVWSLACEQKKSTPTPTATAPSKDKTATKDKPKETTTAKQGESDVAPPLRVDPGDPASPAINKAVAILHPTKGNKATGMVKLMANDKGLSFEANFEGLPPGGKHAFHVHLLGDCSGEDGKTAGTHFHFKGPAKKPPAGIDYITGNFGEITADKDGKGSLKGELAGASLQGTFAILGRSIIIHEKGNDPKSPPIGAAGGRLACGVIGAAE